MRTRTDIGHEIRSVEREMADCLDWQWPALSARLETLRTLHHETPSSDEERNRIRP